MVRKIDINMCDVNIYRVFRIIFWTLQNHPHFDSREKKSARKKTWNPKKSVLKLMSSETTIFYVKIWCIIQSKQPL